MNGHMVKFPDGRVAKYDKLITTTKQDRGTVRIEVWIQDEDVSDCWIVVTDLYETLGFGVDFDRECTADDIYNIIQKAVMQKRVEASIRMRDSMKRRGINVRH